MSIYKKHVSVNKCIFIFTIFIFSSYLGYSNVFQSVSVESILQLEMIGKNCMFLEDSSKSLDINEVTKPIHQLKFQQQEQDVFSRPATQSAFWFKFSTQNFTQEKLWLEVASTYAWYIDFYKPDSMGEYKDVIKTGTMRSDSSKFYDINLFWLPLNNANDTNKVTYYLRIQSGLTYELPLHIGTIQSLSKNKDIYDFITGGFIGLMMIMLLYNLFVYIFTRDHIYLYYLGYIFLMILSMPYANNYPFIQKVNFLFIDKEWWNNNFLIWHPFVYYFIGIFCIRYLNLKTNGPWIRRVILFEVLIISGIFPFLTLLGVPFVELVNSIQIVILIFYLTCLFTAYYLAFKKIKQAYFYLWGWTFMVAGAFVFFAVINGFLPYNPFLRNALYFGVAMEVWMFSLALGHRLSTLQQEKTIIQLENVKLITQQNRQLEEKVKERTASLEMANEELTQNNSILFNTTQELNAQGEDLKKLNKAKDKLFAIISHDFRSPLITLKGLLDLIDNESIDTDTFKTLITNIKKSVHSLYFSLDTVLKWAVSQMENFSNNTEKVSLNGIVSDTILLFDEAAKNKNISLITDIKGDVWVFSDPNYLRLIFRNLINNALKYTPHNGKINISCKTNDDAFQITITDSGIGMSEDTIQNIFNKQTAESKLGTEGEKGAGIGLMLCQDIIEKSNGKFWVESKEGVGSSFHFTIPKQ